jgi:hypothetical protein
LSLALHFFAGGHPYDLMVSHGVGYCSVFASVWGVVDAVNNCPDLAIDFPTLSEQLTISRGFKAMSGAGFDKVIGAIDDILIWTRHKTSKKEYVETVCGEKSFLCHRNDKFGMNIQAICNDKLRFILIDLSWPGCTADYMVWVTSELYTNIEKSKNTITSVFRKGFTLVGDNAYVKSSSMYMPFKGGITELEDSYNFYCQNN